MATKSSGTTVHKIARLSRFLGNGQWKPKRRATGRIIIRVGVMFKVTWGKGVGVGF
jgi:hypothetical protein